MAGRRALAPGPDPIAAGARRRQLLFGVPHRFFFLAGVVQVALVALWWGWVLAARAWPIVPEPKAAVPATSLHALLMLCGFAPLFMFGFLFTAGPRWLGVAPPPPSRWLAPGVVAALAALALVPLQVAGPATGPFALRAAAGAYSVGWLWLMYRFHGLIRASDAADTLHAVVLLGAMLVGASAVMAFALFGHSAHAWVTGAGLWGFMLPVFVTVCHRMIPFFTANVVPFVRAFRPGWLLAALLAAPVLHGVLDGTGQSGWTWVIDLPAAAFLLWLTIQWGLVQSLRNRLLAMLHIGFAWFGIGFLLAGADSLLVRHGAAGVPLGAVHALGIGFASSLLMAMVTRVTCGHSGRTLAADAWTWRFFVLLQVAAVVRIAAAVGAGPAWLALAGLMWLGAFVPWCLRYAPAYWRPRADGRPG